MSEMIARVFGADESEIGSLVELSNGETRVAGRVAQVSDNEFLVEWEDGARSVENKSDYELVIKEKTAAENPAQPAGFAVPPVDANAYPDGELMAIEQGKRMETAEWEDAQNRSPIDGENPAQPAGYAVPPASGQPIPGQGADGLMMAASVTADDVSGENGVVTLSNGDLKVAGRVLAADDESFIVEWEDGRRTVENKNDYDLVVSTEPKTASELHPDEVKHDYVMDYLVKKDVDGSHVCEVCDQRSESEKEAYDHFMSEHNNGFDWDELPGADDRD